MEARVSGVSGSDPGRGPCSPQASSNALRDWFNKTENTPGLSQVSWTVYTQARSPNPPSTSQLVSISQHIQPIADAIAAQTGGDVAIFLVGPIPSRQGQLEARSISATRPGACSSRSWVSDDPEGVTRAEQRLVDYAKGHFSMCF